MAKSIQMKWVISCLLFILKNNVFSFRCDRRPYGSTTQALPPDGRFRLQVLDTENTYIPDQLYTVQITETDGESRFTAFVISAEGDIKQDPKNPRRMISLFPGEIRPQTHDTAKFSDRCFYSVEQTMSSLKATVEVYWQAPPSGNGCVTLRAMVAEKEDVWFEDGAPLTRKLCEDLRQPDDISPQLNYECSICNEAKYELTFTGIWSRNTHPRLYPENDWIPRYSDLIGASHAADFILWTPGTLASDGLRELAEHANTSLFEAEIREQIGDGVRTLIKGKGHGYRKMNNPTFSLFRANKDYHLISTAISLYPSPDWFLGVTRFELCQEDNTWLQERELNLYPWDAGTDSGVSYESPNIETFPKDAVSRVEMSSYDKNSPFYEMDMKDLHPFGKLHIKLVKTYQRECKEVIEVTEGAEVTEGTEVTEVTEGTSTTQQPEETTEPEVGPNEPEEPSSENPIETDPESSIDCPMSQWQDWGPCEGKYADGKVVGYKSRERYHLVDGVAVEKYDPDSKVSHDKEVPEYCKKSYDDFEMIDCTEDYSDSKKKQVEITAERRRTFTPVSPGHPWNSKRDLPKIRN